MPGLARKSIYLLWRVTKLKQTNNAIDFGKLFKNIMKYEINTLVKNSMVKSIVELDFKSFQNKFYSENHQKITYAFDYFFDKCKDVCDGLKSENFHYYDVILNNLEEYLPDISPEVLEEISVYLRVKDRLNFFSAEYDCLDPNMFEYYQNILDGGVMFFYKGLGVFFYDVAIYKIQSDFLERRKNTVEKNGWLSLGDLSFAELSVAGDAFDSMEGDSFNNEAVVRCEGGEWDSLFDVLTDFGSELKNSFVLSSELSSRFWTEATVESDGRSTMFYDSSDDLSDSTDVFFECASENEEFESSDVVGCDGEIFDGYACADSVGGIGIAESLDCTSVVYFIECLQ